MVSHDEYPHQLPIVPTRKLGGAEGLEVSVLGLGCMEMSSFFAPPKSEEEVIELIRYAALHGGITLLDTGDVYGRHANEVLVGKVIMNSSALSTLNPLSLSTLKLRSVQSCPGPLARIRLTLQNLN
jgi:predicted aldo/keto reductase-like oxidoreductase